MAMMVKGYKAIMEDRVRMCSPGSPVSGGHVVHEFFCRWVRVKAHVQAENITLLSIRNFLSVLVLSDIPFQTKM